MCGTEKLSGTLNGMIPGMRHMHDNHITGSVDLVKVVQVDTTQAVHQFSAPTPRTRNMSMDAKVEASEKEVIGGETIKEIEYMI